MRARDASQRGQATLEYAVVVLVVALVLVTAGGVAAAQGDGVADGFTRQVARALCLVSAGDCDRELEPCVVGTGTWTRQAAGTVVVLRLGTDRTVITEERSDGTLTVTFVEADAGGLDLGSGVGGHVGAVRLGGDLAATVLARSGDGAVWELPDARQAPALLERLRRGRWAVGEPAPAATFDEFAWSVALTGAVGAKVQGALGLTAADTYGVRRERSSGRRTFYVRRANDLVGTATLRDTGGSVSAAREEEYAVTVDADGRPVDLAVLRHGRLGGSADLPELVQPAAGLLSVPTRGDRAWVTETHLDLTDPANAATAGAFLAQVRSPRPRLGQAVDVSRALARRLERNGVVHASTYALVGRTSGFDVRGGAGPVRGGLTWSTAETGARLLAAATRGRDGTWVHRVDCDQRA
jgi:Flp pilus assembly pilin Flp